MSTHAQTLRTFFPWTQSPLLCAAPMRGATGSALAAAASNAGALAFYGLGYSVEDPVVLSDLAVTPTLLAPGVGFGIGFLLFKSSLPATLALLHLHRPAAVWFFCPRDPAQLVEWIHAVREAGVGGKVFVQIGSVQEVREMVEAGACPDVVVGQGSGDAGGHGRALGGSWSVLVPELRDYLSRVGKGEVPVFGAGGIMDGRGVVGVLAVGGSGAVLGTVLAASVESEAHHGFKDLIVRTSDGGQNTIRSTVFDKYRGSDFWPAGYDGRGVVNETFREHESGVDEETIHLRYKAAEKVADWDRLTAFVGTGVGLVHGVRPAAEIVVSVREEARGILRGLAREAGVEEV